MSYGKCVIKVRYEFRHAISDDASNVHKGTLRKINQYKK